MAGGDFSLKIHDKKRLFKDRLFRFAVKCGGVFVLAALLLIFVYLVQIVLPIFSDAKVEPQSYSRHITKQVPLALAIDEYGEHAFSISKQGHVDFWVLNASPKLASAVSDYHFQLNDRPVTFAKSNATSNWYAFANEQGFITLLNPQFISSSAPADEHFAPEVKVINSSDLTVKSIDSPSSLSLTSTQQALKKLAAVVTEQRILLAGQTQQNEVVIKWFEPQRNMHDGSQYWQPHSFTFSLPFEHLDQILMTPSGQQVFLRSGSQLTIAVKKGDRFAIRNIIDLSDNDPSKAVKHIDLLSGAYSLLVTHQNGEVSQWFDVLKNKQRQLTNIRQFKLPSQLQYILPDSYRKGFYSFYKNGTLQSHYTTSQKLTIFQRAYHKAPQLAAMSNNELHLLTYTDGELNVAKVNNPYPEISFSALWQKVWYENYPEPDYVWQSTSASNHFEAKFSLMPIAFGTLKAAFYAMIFSVPIAVLGAIYTAYFMSPKMRRVVKPSIELMEALPTVIIGFLAGLWFAPLVETHLTAVMFLTIFLPLSTMLVGVLWQCLPQRIMQHLPNGWHGLILIPTLSITVWLAFHFSTQLEALFFAGDVRLFLAHHGINFEQRNAIVVGFAMSFAVIPTIFTIAEDAVFSVPKHLSDGSLALGATQWQTLRHVVLLTASPGIFSAIMMGLGRAVGETMIVLMATGNTPVMNWNILEGMRTLSATIAVELPESEIGSSHFRLLFLAALLLFLFTFAVNSLAEWVRQRLRDKYSAL